MSNEQINLLIGAGQLSIAVLLWFGLDMKAIREKIPAAPRSRPSVLILILLLGGLGFSIYGYVRAYRADCKKYPSTELETVANKEFWNEEVVVDGKRFDHCKFTNVKLLFHGTAPTSFIAPTWTGIPIIETDNQPAMAGMTFGRMQCDIAKHLNMDCSTAQMWSKGPDGTIVPVQ
jgi:hypothetical protein